MFQSQKPEYLSEESLLKLRTTVTSGRAVAFLDEFKQHAKEGIPEIQSKIWAAIRHLVYDEGIAGDIQEIHERAQQRAIEEQLTEGLSNPLEQEDGEVFAERMRRIRTEICLRALATLGDEAARIKLGMIRARFERTDPSHKTGRKYVDVENKRLKIAITEQVPTNELLDILKLAEDENHSDFMNKVRGTALEFLIRRLVTANGQLIERASKFFTSRYIDAILNQMPDSLADGRIGGKSTGVLLAYAALEQDTPEFDRQFDVAHRFRPGERKRTLEGITFAENESRFIGSRVFESVVNTNPGVADSAILKRYYTDGGSAPDEIHGQIQKGMLEAKFPEHIERQLRVLFMEMHGRPIIIRSSSELEDRIGAAFAGKYESVELANSSDDVEADFMEFKQAILTVYASVFSKDVMEYRKQKGLLVEDEEMGILVQFLNGDRHGDYFYPDFAIVGMSHATQSMGKDPLKGAMITVAGLGEQAVNNGGRYAMLDAPKAGYGDLRPQVGMTVINLRANRKETRPYTDLQSEGGLSGAIQSYGLEGERWKQLSLKGVMYYTEIPLAIEYILQKLKYQLGYDVDCEFTVQQNAKTGKFDIKLVQCRPQNIPENMHPSNMPANIPNERVLLTSDEAMNATHCTDITHLVFIDPKIFTELGPRDRDVRSTVQRINEMFAGEGKKAKYLIVTPLRWGSEEDASGLKARFANFSNAAGAMELFPGEPTSSWGTHFLQDFMDSNMTTGAFRHSGVNFDFFRRAETQEGFEISKKLGPFIKLIDINRAQEVISGRKSETGWCVHVAQDNTGKDSSDKRMSRVYIGEVGKDLPEKVL